MLQKGQISGMTPEKRTENVDGSKKGAGNMDGPGNKDREQGRCQEMCREWERCHKERQGTWAVPQKMAGNGDGVEKRSWNGDGAAKKTRSCKKRQVMVTELQNKDREQGWRGKKIGN